MRALIVDDEPPARQRICSLLADHPDIVVLRECADGISAIESIEELRPDLVFLDVQMPEVTGFDVLDAVGTGCVPNVIFVTAHDEFALRAFDVRALDYLLKPFTQARFEESLNRVRGRKGGEQAQALDSLVAAADGRQGRRIALRKGERIVLVALADIDWICGVGNYLEVQAGGVSYRLRSTLRAAAVRLRGSGFIRISHSAIVNSAAVRAAERKPRGHLDVLLRDGTRLPTSRTYSAHVRRMLEPPAFP